MNYLDTLYRALVDYRKNTLEHNECKAQRSAIITADSENDRIEVTRKNCIVEEDWIEAIEKGLEFIDKAIKEERQFIRSNGEVIPIEKVKRVSKDSVEHLARHSNLFTREPEEGQDLIPDQLYTVERLSDYAVYENRFLYMLLRYLHDFIALRYERIVELTNTYNGNMSMKKEVVESSRKFKFEISLEEEKKNDEYLREHNLAKKEIDRILTIYQAVVVYLNTPLMIEVAKSPMIKPPVTRTNVLKMNRNFKKALELYEYVTAYEGDGYTINTETRVLSPFNGVVADELAEAVELPLFLTYEHGLGIRDYFKERYELEEQRRKEEERKRFAEQLANVRRHLKSSELTPEEYILMLEKRIRDLEKEEEELERAKKTIEALENEISALQAELAVAQETIRELGAEIAYLNKKYADDIAALHLKYKTQINELIGDYENKIEELNRMHQEEVDELNRMHQEEVDELNRVHAEEIDTLNAEHEEAIREMREHYENEILTLTNEYEETIRVMTENHEAEVAELKETHEERIKTLIAEYEAQVHSLKEEKRIADEKHASAIESMHSEYTTTIRTLSEEYTRNSAELNGKIDQGIMNIEMLKARCAKLEEQKTVAEACVNALRAEHGLISKDENFTTREKIDELEHQYIVFRKFFKSEWRKTKKILRREMWQSIFGKKAPETAAEVEPAKTDAAQQSKSSMNAETTGIPSVNAVNGESKAETPVAGEIEKPANSAVEETGTPIAVETETSSEPATEDLKTSDPTKSVKEVEETGMEQLAATEETTDVQNEKDEDKA